MPNAFLRTPVSVSCPRAGGCFFWRGSYEARPDKGYSLTDCISIQTMRKEALTEVLTTDRHLEKVSRRYPRFLNWRIPGKRDSNLVSRKLYSGGSRTEVT